MAQRAVIVLNVIATGESHDVDVPLDITAAELLEGLNEGYGLSLGDIDPASCYVKAENPTVLMHGRKTLEQHGIMDGSVINVTGQEGAQ